MYMYIQEVTFKEVQERCLGVVYLGKERTIQRFQTETFKDDEDLRNKRRYAMTWFNADGLVDTFGNSLNGLIGYVLFDFNDKDLTPHSKRSAVFNTKKEIDDYIQHEFTCLNAQFPVLTKEKE